MESKGVAGQPSFDVLFYSNPQPMWVFDVYSLQILDVNNAAVEKYGYTRSELLARTIQDLRPAEDVPFLHDILPSIRDTTTNRREFRHLTKSGKIVFVDIISYPMVYQGVKARIVYACSMDERRELAGKLKLTQKRLLHILETTVIGFLQLDFNWTITYWNKAAEELVGYGKELVVGRNLWSVLPEILHSDFHDCFQKAMGNRENFDFVDYFWPTQKWLMCNAYPAEGGIIVHFRDITNKKLTQESLLEKIDQLKEISYLNSHALRKPIASLLGLTQLITRELIKPEEYKDISALINECSLELDDVVKEVNRMVSNDDYLQPLDMVMEVFSFGNMLTEVVQEVQPLYKKHLITIEEQVNIDFYGTKQGIEQALKYLIDNAVKYSPGKTEVVIKTEIINNNVVLSVKDFGIGMDDLQLHRLFIHINQKKHVSISSGLPKINEICRRHHGNMWIESQPRQGSIFSMRFPLSNIGVFKATGTTDFSIFQNSGIDIEYVAAHRYLKATWSGFQNFFTVRDGCIKLLAFMNTHQCQRIYNDNTNVLGGWMEACDWIVEEWFPVAHQAGLRYLTWVYSPSAFSKLSTVYTLAKLKSGIKAKAFDDAENARQWLISQ